MPKDAAKVISIARVQLMSEFHFFGYLTMNLCPVADAVKAQGTASINAKGDMFYDPNWIETLSTANAMFVVAHEVMHLVTRCHERFPKGGDFMIWNIANDIVINTILMDSGLQPPQEIKNAFPAAMIEKYRNWTTNAIYYDLLKNMPPQLKGQGQCCDASNTIEMNPEDVEKWKQRVMSAAERAKGKGNLPGFAEAFIAELLSPAVTWKDILRAAAISVFKGRYTWKKPNRRAQSLNLNGRPLRLPSRIPTKEGAIIALDCSGSISDEELNQFVTECWEILNITGCPWIKIYMHDVEVYKIQEYTKSTLLTQIEASRGGTSHIDVFEKVKENEQKVGMLIAFTDLATSFPAEAPSYPVIWAYSQSYGDNIVVPFGRKVKVDLTND
jgi:predicted metal-dependent peptidase